MEIETMPLLLFNLELPIKCAQITRVKLEMRVNQRVNNVLIVYTVEHVGDTTTYYEEK